MPAAVLALTGALLGAVNEAMKKFPDYDQKKQQEFYELSMEYQSEITKTYFNRDDDLVLNLHDSLCKYVEVFTQQISSQKTTG